jgi:hypothetical protein
MDTQIDIGTVGWEGDDTFYEKGTAENDGYTLVKVQLYRGRNQSKPLKAGIGQGHKVLCHISSGVFRIPPRGTRVYVAFPRGMETVPGAGVIMAAVEKNPQIQFEEDRVVLDFGTETHVVIKGKSVNITDFEDRFISVGEPRTGGDSGIVFQCEDGTGGYMRTGKVSFWTSSGPAQDAQNLFQLENDKINIILKNGGYIRIDAAGGGKMESFALNNFMKGTCWIGALPNMSTGATYSIPNVLSTTLSGPGISAPALIGSSASVYISPV